MAKSAAKPVAKTVAKRPARGAVKPVAAKKPAAARKTAAKPAARRITAKRIAPKRTATATKTAAKKITPKQVTTAKRMAPAKSTTARKVTAKKVTPKRIAPKRRTTARRTTRTKATPVKFTPGERTLAPIACATRQTAPDAVALCTDCPDHALSEAYALLGLKYRRGGTSQETGMDCSGFTQHVYRRSCNVDLPRSASQQFQVGVPTQKEELLRGDLVFFRSRRGWHVGIYTGDGNFIHSPNRRSSVKISSLSAAYYKKTYLGARRLTQNIIEPLTIDRPLLQSLPEVPALTDAEAEAEADEAADAEEAANEEAANEEAEAGSGNAGGN
ncbi:MAG: C40 family peptidase [Bryobacterales bacterium]|nr:C40 family peptidase [Bryobacterales bacterium]